MEQILAYWARLGASIVVRTQDSKHTNMGKIGNLKVNQHNLGYKKSVFSILFYQIVVEQRDYFLQQLSVRVLWRPSKTQTQRDSISHSSTR